MLEYGNDGMVGERRHAGTGRGTRLRALDEQALVSSEGTFFQPVRRRHRKGGYSNIPSFQYSNF